MDPTIAALVLASAFLHPLRDSLIKGNTHPEAAYFGVILTWIVVGSVHAAITGADPWSGVAVWPLAILSASGLLLYYVGVMTTLRSGDLSVYYPIIRSTPLSVVVLGFVFLGHRYSPVLLVGVTLVLTGAFFLQYRRGAHFFSQPRVLATAFVALFGLGVVSLADAAAMQTVEPVVLILWVNTFLALFYATYLVATKPAGRPAAEHFFAGLVRTPRRVVAGGVLSYSSYLLILIAFQLGGNVAAVTALRQASIPVSIVLGGVFLKEAGIAGRFVWSTLLIAGIVVIIFTK